MKSLYLDCQFEKLLLHLVIWGCGLGENTEMEPRQLLILFQLHAAVVLVNPHLVLQQAAATAASTSPAMTRQTRPVRPGRARMHQTAPASTSVWRTRCGP